MSRVTIGDMTNPAQYTSPSPGGSPWQLPQLRHCIAIPLVVVLLTATIGRLLVLSPQAADGETALLEGLSHHRNPLLDVAATAVDAALSAGVVVLIIAAITGWLAVVRRRPLDAAGFGITSLAGWGAVGLVKLAVERPRPALAGDTLEVANGSMSFPSSHMGAMVAILLGLGLVAARRSTRRRILLLGTVALVAVGAARMYSGAHYLLDVLASVPVACAGAAAGAALANTIVPALAYGFGWRQAGMRLENPVARRADAEGTGSHAVPSALHSAHPARGATAHRAAHGHHGPDETRENRAA